MSEREELEAEIGRLRDAAELENRDMCVAQLQMAHWLVIGHWQAAKQFHERADAFEARLAALKEREDG